MGNDPKQGEDFVKVPMPKTTDDVEGHRQGLDSSESDSFVKVPMPKQGEDFVKVPMPKTTSDSDS